MHYLERIDGALRGGGAATLHIYGSAAYILLDEPDRTSLDINVEGPYSQADEADVRQAAEAAGVPVNPGEDYGGDHIEWVGPLRLCLQPPIAGTEVTLWRGTKLQLQTGPVADLIASKLIRDIGLPRFSRMIGNTSPFSTVHKHSYNEPKSTRVKGIPS